MNKLIPMVLGIALLGCLASCGEKKKSTVIIAQKPAAPKPKKPQKMSNNEQSRNVSWLGSSYKLTVKRTADTSLPLAQSEYNAKYYDNKIEVCILRKDGTEFFHRVFTKTDFASCLDEETLKTGALLGFVFDKMEADCLVFAASVGSPDIASDEYVPLVVKISRMGAVSMTRDTSLDTDGDDEKASSQKDEADDGV